MKVLIAADHAGYPLKELIKVQRTDIQWSDLGAHNSNPVDYPDIADQLASQLKPSEFGVLLCGSGQGMAMRANKYPNIRAALCWDTHSARLAREHNDANVLCMGGRMLSFDLALAILDVFLKTPFAGDRHARRVNKVNSDIKK